MDREAVCDAEAAAIGLDSLPVERRKSGVAPAGALTQQGILVCPKLRFADVGGGCDEKLRHREFGTLL